ncbi:hypothetical protein DK846_00680 [Methanospirillum lacunae]|uniref:Uncharacterized protein n=1 Tax=Methanospirillum lacunae TaxID=668570 RepID=A0A2V2NDP6_9EURY|nr:hypothetical protein DK846_00680 [Methanospirillum lacunae]
MVNINTLQTAHLLRIEYDSGWLHIWRIFFAPFSSIWWHPVYIIVTGLHDLNFVKDTYLNPSLLPV